MFLFENKFVWKKSMGHKRAVEESPLPPGRKMVAPLARNRRP